MKILLLSVLAVAMIGLMVPSVYATQFPSYAFEMDIHETWSSEEVDVKLEIQKGGKWMARSKSGRKRRRTQIRQRQKRRAKAKQAS